MKNSQQIAKIAFVGTSCIGKTTLLEYYQARFQGNQHVACVPEAARLFFQQHTVTNPFSAKSQGAVQSLALCNEQEAHASGAKLILCDRSVLDAVAYVRANGDSEGARALLHRVQYWLPSYTRFMLLDPADIPYQTDAIRQEDAETRSHFHEAFLDLFQEIGISYDLLSGTLPERINKINELPGLSVSE